MADETDATVREWRVPMRLHFRDAEVLVKAATAEEAERKADDGDWDCISAEGECADWYKTGHAVENV